MSDYTFQWAVAFSHLPYLLGGAWITLQLTFIGFGIGMVGGLAAAVGQVYGGPWTRRLIKAYVVFFTNTPALVTAFFLFFGLPEFGILLSPFVCILVNLALKSGAYLTDVFRAGFHSVRRTELEAAEVLGFSLWQKVHYVVVPHIAKTLYAPISNLYIVFLIGSAYASIFGVEELTGRAFNVDARTVRSLEIYTITAGVYVLLSIAASIVLAAIGRYVFRVRASIF